jgi:hypothetical protein
MRKEQIYDQTIADYFLLMRYLELQSIVKNVHWYNAGHVIPVDVPKSLKHSYLKH